MICWVCSNSLLVDKLEMPLTIGQTPIATYITGAKEILILHTYHTCTLSIWSFDFRTWPRKGKSLSSYKCTTYIANSGGLGCFFFFFLFFSFFLFIPHLRNVEKPGLGKYSIWRTSESKEIRQPGRENHGLGAGGKGRGREGDTDATVFIFPAARNQSWNACMHRCKLELLVCWPDDYYYKHTFSYAVTAYNNIIRVEKFRGYVHMEYVVDEVSRSEKYKKK